MFHQKKKPLFHSVSFIILLFAMLCTFGGMSHCSSRMTKRTPLTLPQRQALQLTVNNVVRTLQQSSKDWKYALSIAFIEYSHIAVCEPSQTYPETLDLPDNTLVVCRSNNAGIPYVMSNTTGYFFSFASLMEQELQNRYKKEFTIQWVDVNVGTSFYPSLRDAVNNDECDLVFSNVVNTGNRSEEVDFGCAFAAGRNSILRSTLDPSLQLDTFEKLNDPNVKVGVVAGPVVKPANANITVVGSYSEGFDLILKNELHAFLWSSITVNNWVGANCPDCVVYPYGNVSQYSLFFKQGASVDSSNSGVGLRGNSYASLLFMTVLSMASLLLFI